MALAIPYAIERLLSNPVISMFLFWRNAMMVFLERPAHYSETPDTPLPGRMTINRSRGFRYTWPQ